MFAGEMKLSTNKARADISFAGDELSDSLVLQGFNHIEDLLKMEFTNEEPLSAKCNDLLATAMYQHILTDGATEPDEPVNQLPPWSPLTPESQTVSEVTSLTSELQDDVQRVTSELQDDVPGVTSELQDDVSGVTSELQDDVPGVTSELQDDVSEVTSELQDDFSGVTSEHQDDGITHIHPHFPEQQLQETDDLHCCLDDLVPETLHKHTYSVIEPVSAPPSSVVVIRNQNLCSGCDGCITDRYILQVNGLLWHETCLRCCECHLQLGYHGKCYVKDGRNYCKQHYQEMYGVRCTKCDRVVAQSDLVHHVGRNVYHMTCFACTTCRRLLSTGEQFSVQGSDLICCDHADRSSNLGLTSLTRRGPTKRSAVDDPGSPKKPKSKRLRTQFTDEQVELLKEEYKQETNPVGSDLERIALTVGLSRRVTQIWFQNTRARNRKQQS